MEDKKKASWWKIILGILFLGFVPGAIAGFASYKILGWIKKRRGKKSEPAPPTVPEKKVEDEKPK